MAEFELDAFIAGEGEAGRSPFRLRISRPVKSEGSVDWSCLVHAPSLFENDKNIFGVDEEQARALAIEFVKALLCGKRLVNGDGEIIEL
jgi:hypothetical protein